MPRGATRRTWVKLFITGWLHGSIRWQLEPDERSVWADLICMAGECGKEGRICDNDNRPYPRAYIATHLNVPQILLDRTIAKCKHEGRLEDRDDILIITNWKTYQSEYDRQKPYREKAATESKRRARKEKPASPTNNTASRPTIPLPEWLNKETWESFLEMRGKQKANPTNRAIVLLFKELGKFRLAGDDPNEILNQSIMNNWKGVFGLKPKGGNNGANQGIPGNRPAGAFADLEKRN